MKKMVLLALFVIAGPNVAGGSGVPTVDIPALMQNLMRYANELKEYAEIIETHAVKAAHLYEAIQMYNQKLVEYQHYLNEIQALKDQIDRRDWWAINEAIKQNLRRFKSLRQKYLDEADPDAVTADDDLTKMLRNYDEVPLTDAEMTAYLNALNMDAETLRNQVDKDRINYQLKKERLKDAARLEQESRKRREGAIRAHKAVLDRLAGKNGTVLATDQAMVNQGITKMRQREALIRIKIQTLHNLQTKRERVAAQNSAMRKAELKRLKARTSSRAFGNNRFGEM